MSRFRFTLDKIKIDPVSHLRLVRHAKENAYFKATGLVYGAMYDDCAEVTAVVPFAVSKPVPVEEDTKDQGYGLPTIVEERRQDVDGEYAKRKYEDMIPKFNLDEFKLGRYVVTYRKDFWSEIKNTKIMESKQRTSFLLILDYSLLQSGANPYRAFRLKREYVDKPAYNWNETCNFNYESANPFVEIPVEVTKSTLFEALVQLNKKEFVQPLTTTFSEDKFIESEIENYKTVIGNQIDRLGVETEIFVQSKDKTHQRGSITPQQYNQFLNKSSTVHHYKEDFKRYGANVLQAQSLFQAMQE